jgi:ribosome recycling factor
MATVEEICTETEQRMGKAIESFKKDLQRVRTGRATPALLEGVMVDYYGNSTPINQVANVSVPDARMLMVQPWEKTMLSPIEKAIQAAGLGLNPQNDGNLIRIPIPSLNEERRKDLLKTCKKSNEDCKVAIRNVRRDSNEKLKKAESDKQITEDDHKKALERTQKITDKWIKAADDQLAIKEKEILDV